VSGDNKLLVFVQVASYCIDHVTLSAEEDGCAPNKEWFTVFTKELRSQMQSLLAVVHVATGHVYDGVAGSIMHTCYLSGCTCRRCQFK
jgi:hypothetical protein